MKFIVPGQPKAQGRPRFTTRGGFPRAYDPSTSRDFKSKVAYFFKADGGKMIQEGAVILNVTAYFKRPKRLSKKYGLFDLPMPCRPDADNVLKIICDALNGIAFRDDAQVSEATIIKRYHEIGGVPRVEVEIK